MTDLTTQEAIIVRSENTGGPYIMVPSEQLEEVEAILRANKISFWTDSDTISLDGKPAIAVINLGRGANAATVQRLLDAAD